MKKLHDVVRALTIVTGLATLVLSCSTDNEKSPSGGEPISQAELQTILHSDDVSGSVDMVLADLYTADNPSAKKSLIAAKISSDCYEMVQTETGFTATFNNCVLNTTENANGTVSVVYETGSQAAAFTATFTDFYIGDVKVNGSRSYAISAGADQSSIEFTVVSDIELTFSNESIIDEVGTRTLVFHFGDTLEASTLTISGNWTVEMDGNTYVLEVSEDLVGNFGCDNLVSGLLYVGKNGLGVTVDFGDGTCDNLATIIYPDDTTQEITLDDQ